MNCVKLISTRNHDNDKEAMSKGVFTEQYLFSAWQWRWVLGKFGSKTSFFKYIKSACSFATKNLFTYAQIYSILLFLSQFGSIWKDLNKLSSKKGICKNFGLFINKSRTEFALLCGSSQQTYLKPDKWSPTDHRSIFHHVYCTIHM